MQIQKHLYRIAQRSLKSTSAPTYIKVIFYTLVTVCLYLTTLFIYGFLVILPHNNQLSSCFRQGLETNNKANSTFVIEKDAIYLVYSTQIDITGAKQNIVVDNDICSIVKNLDVKYINEHPLQFTWSQNMLILDSSDRVLYNIANFTIVFKQENKLRNILYHVGTLLSNQLITNPLKIFPPQVFIKCPSILILSPLPPVLNPLQKLIRIIKSLIYYLIISIVTSLYIYGTIIAAPAVIMIFIRCSNFARNGGNVMEVYKIFPWVGIHQLVRDTSSSDKVRQKAGQVCKAIIFYFFILYFIYYAIILQVSNDIFFQKAQEGLAEMLYGYIALIQFCAIVFMRTRPFLKYYPTIHTMLMLLFILYCQFQTFGLKKLACMIVCSASASLFAFMIMKLEIPGQTTWNRASKYTPTIDRPRIGMLPLFNLAWINSLPDEWTLLFPLFGRQNFTHNQLAFVDRNFQELDQILNNNIPQPLIQQ